MFAHYFDFKGRVGRLACFVNGLKFAAVALLASLLFMGLVVLVDKVSTSLAAILAILGGVVFYGIIFVFSFSQSAKRAHDLGHSGWVTLLLLVPLFGLIPGLYLSFAPGNKGSNNYGEPENG